MGQSGNVGFFDRGGDFEHSLAIARQVLPFLGKHAIPATPENYMIFYLYFERAFAHVVQVVDEHLGSGQPWTFVTTRTIFDRLFSAEANLELFKHNEAVTRQVRDMTQGIIDATNSTAEMADQSGEKMRDYLDVLRQSRELAEAALWLENAIAEMDRVSQASQDLGGKLRHTGEELQGIVDSLHRMERLAYTDELTQLANRRAWEHHLATEFDRFARYRTPCALLLLDIDDFKVVNDHHGHLVGDEALRAVARLLRLGLRKVDYPARYGGEEFTALMPETGLEVACRVAERLRLTLAETPLTLRGQDISLTASFGVAEFLPDDPTPEPPMLRADAAMYLAKSAGKNRVRSQRDLGA